MRRLVHICCDATQMVAANSLDLDGVIDVTLVNLLSRGSGSLHGVDSSPKMIEAAQAAVGDANNCTFEGRLWRWPFSPKR